jgi:protein-tyrosine phosphatase
MIAASGQRMSLMRQITPYRVWIGNVGDVARLEQLSQTEVQALVDLADNEKPSMVFRDWIYCRIPLVDGSGNPEWLLRLATETVVQLLQAEIPTLVFCSAGMSRSPSIVAAALSRLNNRPMQFGLDQLKEHGSFDISPSLWASIEAALSK